MENDIYDKILQSTRCRTLSTNVDIEMRPIYGSGKGKMRIADDFDAPVDELKEYTE